MGNSVDDTPKKEEERKNDENSNSVKDERSPSPAGQIISVETVALPERLSSSINPDEVDLKIEIVESVSDNNSGQIREENLESKEYCPSPEKVSEVDLRRVLDSDSDSDIE